MTFKYETHSHEQIQSAIQKGLTNALLLISPRAVMHMVAAGCIMHWKCDRETMTYKLTPIYQTLVITQDNSNLVIVYEKRPKKLGGPKAISLKYVGPQEKLMFSSVMIGQTQPDDDIQIEDILDGPPPPDDDEEEEI